MGDFRSSWGLMSGHWYVVEIAIVTALMALTLLPKLRALKLQHHCQPAIECHVISPVATFSRFVRSKALQRSSYSLH